MTKYIDTKAFLEHMKGTSRYFDVKFDIESFPRRRRCAGGTWGGLGSSGR